MKPFKSNEKRFLFHVKSSFRSLRYLIFVPTFLVMYEDGFMLKLRLISKLITLQIGKKIITIEMKATRPGIWSVN